MKKMNLMSNLMLGILVAISIESHAGQCKLGPGFRIMDGNLSPGAGYGETQINSREDIFGAIDELKELLNSPQVKNNCTQWQASVCKVYAIADSDKFYAVISSFPFFNSFAMTRPLDYETAKKAVDRLLELKVCY